MSSYLAATGMQSIVNAIVGTISGNTGSRRDRMDYMLEPLQAMTQICSLAFLPIGTKLHIESNILYTHAPGMGQGITRYLAGDGKDDLYYLCNVFIQFINWYGQPSDNNQLTIACRESGLFDMMIMLAKTGLDRLIQTYRTSDKPTVLHTLGIYRMILCNPKLFMVNSKNNQPTNNMTDIATYNQIIETLPHGFSAESAGIDRRPKTPIYTSGDFQVLHGLLQLMSQSSDNQSAISSYIKSVDYMMQPRHECIRRWIMNSVGL